MQIHVFAVQKFLGTHLEMT